MPASLSGVYNLQVMTDTGAPAASYRLYTYTQGTTTHKVAYTDAAASVAHTYTSDGAGGLYIGLNSRGELPAPLFLTTGAYDITLKTAAGSSVWTRYARGQDDSAATTDAALRADLVSTADIAKGDALLGVKLSATGATARTQDAKNADFVSVFDFMTTAQIADVVAGTLSVDVTAAIQAAENACALSNQKLQWPGGKYKCLTGITKKAVDWLGAGLDRTMLYYYGSGTLINATGSSGDRVICTIAGIKLDGTNATGNAKGITIGWNQRSMPFLQSVHIYNFPHYGMHFNDQNWLVTFRDVQVDTCGRTTANSAGIYKDGAVDFSTWNDIIFDACFIEACGNSSSAAGGINLRTATANRGIYFINCCTEGNFGTDECFFENLGDLQLANHYVERESVVGQVVGLDFEGCHGGMTGGFISSAGANNDRGLRIVNSNMTLTGVNLGFWPTASIDNQSSIVTTSGCFTIQTGAWAPLLASNVTSAGNVQWYGDLTPKVSAHKNGTNQTAIVTNVFTKVTFGTEVYDSVGSYASSTFTPKSIGTYQVDAQVTWVSSVDQDRPIIAIYLNGTIYRSFTANVSGTGGVGTRISAQVPITAVTDYIEIYARQTSGSNKDILGTPEETWFMASLIGRAT